MATYELREAVNISAQEVHADVEEFELAGLTKAPSKLVKPFRVAESPIPFDCEYYQTIRLPLGGAKRAVDFQMIIPDSLDKPGLLAGLEGAMSRFQREMGETVDIPKLPT